MSFTLPGVADTHVEGPPRFLGERSSDSVEKDRISTWPRLSGLGILVSHAVADAYTAFVPAALVLLEGRCHLSDGQSAWLLGAGSIISGVTQPLSAYLGDRWKTRLAAPIGLICIALAMGWMGTASGFATLFAVYFVSMLGSGMYHPVAASAAGQLAGSRRNLGVSGFFVAGMLGQTLGGLSAAWIAPGLGDFPRMILLAVPGVVLALALTRCLPRTQTIAPPARRRESTRTFRDPMWGVAILYLAAAIRFTVNMALWYLAGRLAKQSCGVGGTSGEAATVAAAALTGRFQAATTIGMGVGGLAAGLLIRSGREKWPLVLVPLLTCPAIWFFPAATGPARYLLAAIAGLGFASMVPVGITVVQHLLPHRVNFASGLMLGGAWSVAIVGPPAADWLARRAGLSAAFEGTAILLAVSGLIVLPLRLEPRNSSPLPVS